MKQALLGWAVMGERVTAAWCAGLLLIFAGVCLVARGAVQ